MNKSRSNCDSKYMQSQESSLVLKHSKHRHTLEPRRSPILLRNLFIRVVYSGLLFIKVVKYLSRSYKDVTNWSSVCVLSRTTARHIFTKSCPKKDKSTLFRRFGAALLAGHRSLASSSWDPSCSNSAMLAQWALGLFETLMLVMMLILVIICVLICIAILTMRGTS